MKYIKATVGYLNHSAIGLSPEEAKGISEKILGMRKVLDHSAIGHTLKV